MKTLPIDASEEQIRGLVIEWTELLARERYEEAMELILYEEKEYNGGKWTWTAEKLEAAIYSYGMPWYSREEIEEMFGEGEANHRVTSIDECPDREEVINSIDISAMGWQEENDISMVHFWQMPLDGKASDLTAIFHIRKIGENAVTLSLDDIHVM